MYHVLVGEAPRSGSGESGTEMRTARRKKKRKEVSWRNINGQFLY
jgi:hypothetical protein